MQSLIILFTLLTLYCPSNGKNLIRDEYKFSDSLELNPSVPNIILPSLLIAGGYIVSKVKYLNSIDRHFQDVATRIGPTGLDRYLLGAPTLSVFVLKISGFEGKNSIRTASLALVGSMAIQTALVQSLKYSTQMMRPDSSARNSFPSMHTAFAFGGAEFLRMEYWDRMPWIAIGGYLAAGTVGVARISNSKHWLSDVISGAGIGILSTKISYSLVYHVKKRNDVKNKAISVVTPYGNTKSQGISVSIFF